MTHESLKDDYTKADSARRAFETLHQDGNQERAMKELQARINENENLIAIQENQLEDNRVSNERLERELNSLRPAAIRVKEFDDEVKELKSQNDALGKKANMVDHYIRKLEASNNVERDNKYLRSRIDTLEENQKDYDTVHQLSERRENTIQEYGIKFAAYELDFTNVNSEFAILKSESRQKDFEIETLKARQAADERFIQELQEQISSTNHVPHFADSSGEGPRNLTLEDELAEAPDPSPNYLLDISRLQAENQLLKSGIAGTTNATLQTDLEESERKCKRLAENLRDLTEQQAITQKQLEAALKTSTHEKYVLAVDEAMKQGPFKMLMVEFYRDEAIASTRELERNATEDLKATKAKLADIQSQLTSQYRDLVAAQADCTINFRFMLRTETNWETVAAVDQDELDALENLKQTNQIITSSFKNDLILLQSRHKNLIIDFDQQRAHLVESLLDRESLRKDLEIAKIGRSSSLDLAESGRNKDIDAEEEKVRTASQSLKEVSPEYDSRRERKPKNVAKLFGKLVPSRIRNEPPKVPFLTGDEAIEARELARERQAIGSLQSVHLDNLSSILPRTPPPVRCYTQDLDRSRKRPMIQTNKYRSGPNNKK